MQKVEPKNQADSKGYISLVENSFLRIGETITNVVRPKAEVHAVRYVELSGGAVFSLAFLKAESVL